MREQSGNTGAAHGSVHCAATLASRYAAQPSTATNGLISAQVALLPEPPSVTLPPEHRVCARVLHMIVRKMGEERFNAPFKFDDAEWVGYRLAETLPLKPIVKQKMLEMNDAVMRLEILHKFLASQGLAK